MLIKRMERHRRHGNLADALQAHANGGLDRRAFLNRSGLAAGSLAAVGVPQRQRGITQGPATS